MPPLDFPASPSNGQTYAGPGGAVWSWDGAKWVNGASASAVVSSFNTRTGAVTLSSGDVTALGAYAGTFTTLSASGAVSGAGFTSLLSPYAPLASPTFTGTVTLPTTNAGAVTATTLTAPLVGVTNGGNAAAGQVGEVIQAIVAPTGAALTANVFTQITNIALTAGDWDVFGLVGVAPGSGASVSTSIAGPSSSATSVATYDVFYLAASFAAAAFPYVSLPFPTFRLNIAAPATVYLGASVNFTGGTCNGFGRITARRRR